MQARLTLKSYITNKNTELGIREQMGFFEEVYQILQDWYLVIRACRKRGEAVPLETVQEWEKVAKKMDDKFRERIFILTIAAEEGWKIASEVAFQKKGNEADKDLAKVSSQENKFQKAFGF